MAGTKTDIRKLIESPEQNHCSGLFLFLAYGGGMTYSRSSLFIILAFAFFLLDTLMTGGVITASLPWLLPAGLTSLALGLVA
jgi:hypothetical protein